MQMIPFVKMEGAGNDFVVLDLTKASFGLADGLLTSIADRRRGVGADQVLVLEQTRSDDADFRYRIFNGDGQEVEQCGNGARCIARFVRVKKNFRARRIRFETLKGVISVSEDENGWMTVDLGRPCFGAPSIPFCPSFWPEADEMGGFVEFASGERSHFNVASMGNPHAVFFVSSVERFPLEEAAHILQHHPAFPESVNVGVVERFTAQEARIRVFERGAGETPACGTGTCAAFAVGRRLGLFDECVRFEARGGSLACRESKDGCVLLSGPAQFIAEGRFYWNVENV